MTLPQAYAEESLTSYPYDAYNNYGYTIVQWEKGKKDNAVNYGLCYGEAADGYHVATYNPATHSLEVAEEVNQDYNTWNEVVTSDNYCTIMFDGNSTPDSNGDVYYDINGVKFSGIIVDDNTSVDKLYGNGGANAGARDIKMGGSTEGTPGYSYIGRNFELSLANSTHENTKLELIGTQTWNIKSGVTYTINTGDNAMTQSGTLNVTGGGTLKISQSFTIGGSVTFDAESSLQLEQGANITINGAANTVNSISKLTAHTNGNTITLQGETAKLNRIASVTGGEVTLKGNGIYDMGGNYTSNVSGLNNSENWTGKVILSGAKDGLNFNDYGNANSTIEIGAAGITNYLNKDNTTYASNIVMTGNLALSNGWSGNTKTFSGDVSGNGTFSFNYSGTTADTGTFSQAWKFTGNVSEWRGAVTMDSTSGKAAIAGTVEFSGTSAINLESISKNDRATLNVTISDTTQGSSKSQVTVASAITATKLTANATQGVALNGAVTVDTLEVGDGGISGSGNVTVNTGMTLNAADSVNLTGSLIFGAGATLTLSDSLVSTIVQGTETSYTLATAGSIASGVTLSNTFDWTGTGFSGYELAVQSLSTPATYSGESAAVNYQALVLNLIPTPTPLTTLVVNGAAGYENQVLTLTTQEAATGVVFGDALDVTISDDIWAQITKDYTLDEEYSITFVGADGTTFDFDGDGTLTAPTITFMGETATAFTGNGTIVGTFTIPEPTTATLSLLALAALAARRRRR